MDRPNGNLISIVIPVFNEAGNIERCLSGIASCMADLPHETLVCYDFAEDNSLAAIKAMADRPKEVRLVKNNLGKGASYAIQAGFNQARGDVVVVTMADLSDEPRLIPDMARKVREEGCAVVSGSRYMKGGRQIGGPFLKGLLSRAAGLSLYHIGGFGTHDSTTSFKAYAKIFLDGLHIESVMGFDLSLELTVKAHLSGQKVCEVPSTWRDRSKGKSRFNLIKWLPVYLKWWIKGLLGSKARVRR